jgi:hypothetical protein
MFGAPPRNEEKPESGITTRIRMDMVIIDSHESSIKVCGSLATSQSTTFPKTPNNEASAIATNAVSTAISNNHGSNPAV